MLVILAGLPGVGKSAVADRLASRLGAVVISVDPIEAAIIRSGIARSFETGLAAYGVGAAVAEHQLRLGITVVADAANYLEPGRRIWRAAADNAGVQWRAIEVICSDEREHRRRLETRRRHLEPYPEPTWDDVIKRRVETEAWSHPRLVIDTADPVEVNVEAALRYLHA